jgi:hypothetical protein
MTILKALLAGLMGASLCMADISGLVTDTSGTIPISGAAVQLEKGGQAATTGNDGSFTLAGIVGIAGPCRKSLPRYLSAAIHNGLLCVNVAQKSAVEIAAFALNGKALSTVHKIIDAGTHSIALPRTEPGVYLYKVKAGNTAFVLRSYSLGREYSGKVAGFSVRLVRDN